MENSMLFKGAWVSLGITEEQITQINTYVHCGIWVVSEKDIKPIHYTPKWAEKVMPKRWNCHFAIVKAQHRQGWYLEANGNHYFEFVHELQLLVVAIRLEEEIKSLCGACKEMCNNKLF